MGLESLLILILVICALCAIIYLMPWVEPPIFKNILYILVIIVILLWGLRGHIGL